jgi:hypothetical protein
MIIPASAASYQFVPSPADLGDLDHGYYYSWGINWAVPAGQHISEATLFISQINDWTAESNDHLYIHLLDNPQLGVKQWYDGEGGGDHWAGNPLVANYTDTNSYAENLTYQLSALDLLSPLRTYVANNNVFGLGFDPDCHYYNCGVKLIIETADGEYPPVPEPSGMLALAVGMTSLGGLMRKRSA